jgi:hypothetical protein
MDLESTEQFYRREGRQGAPRLPAYNLRSEMPRGAVVDSSALHDLLEIFSNWDRSIVESVLVDSSGNFDRAMEVMFELSSNAVNTPQDAHGVVAQGGPGAPQQSFSYVVAVGLNPL